MRKKLHLIAAIIVALTCENACLIASEELPQDAEQNIAGILLKMARSAPEAMQEILFTPTSAWELALSKEPEQEIIERLKKLSFDVNQVFSISSSTFGSGSADGNILHRASEKGYLDLVRYLIEERGSATGIITSTKRTCLDIAALNGHLEVVKYFIEGKNMPIHKQTSKTPSPLYLAASKGHLEVAKYLVERGADMHRVQGYSPLYIAASKGHLDIVRYLVEMRADITLENSSSKYLPLHIAAKYGQIAVVSFFIKEKGMNVDTKTSQDMSPLSVAILNHKFKSVKYLVENGADVSGVELNKIKNPSIKEYLQKRKKMLFKPDQEWAHSVFRKTEKDVIEYLRKKTFDANQVFLLSYIRDGKPLDLNVNIAHVAIIKGYFDVFKYLVEEKKVRIGSETPQTFSFLNLAVCKGHLETVKYLVENGADLSNINLEQIESAPVREYLISKGAVIPGESSLPESSFSAQSQELPSSQELEVAPDLESTRVTGHKRGVEFSPHVRVRSFNDDDGSHADSSTTIKRARGA